MYRYIVRTHGNVFPARGGISLCNVRFVEQVMLVPTYAQPDLDHEAMTTIQQAYPDRQVVGIDCRAVVRQHGSLHCCTMQYY